MHSRSAVSWQPHSPPNHTIAGITCCPTTTSPVCPANVKLHHPCHFPAGFTLCIESRSPRWQGPTWYAFLSSSLLAISFPVFTRPCSPTLLVMSCMTRWVLFSPFCYSILGAPLRMAFHSDQDPRCTLPLCRKTLPRRDVPTHHLPTKLPAAFCISQALDCTSVHLTSLRHASLLGV